MKYTLLYAKSLEDSELEIESLNGRVVHILSSSPIIIIAELPENLKISQLQSVEENSDHTLDETSQLIVDAWHASQNDALSSSAKKGLPWDTEGFEIPGAPERREKEVTFIPSATSQYFNGEIALILCITSGPGNLAMNYQEKLTSLTQVFNGTHYLATLAPDEKIKFKYINHLETLSVTADPSVKTKTQYENVWLLPLMEKLGYQATATNNQVKSLVETTRTQMGSNWAFAAFISKYPLYHFAYQHYQYVCMEYQNGSWGPNEIAGVFAHETLHAFGAADEYRGSPCTCSPSGIYNIPNYNCQNCNSVFTKVPCIMNMNLLDMCGWTKGQVAWSDPKPQGGLTSSFLPATGDEKQQLFIGFWDKKSHVTSLTNNTTNFSTPGWTYQDINTLQTEAPASSGEVRSNIYDNKSFNFTLASFVYKDINNEISGFFNFVNKNNNSNPAWEYVNLTQSATPTTPPKAGGTPIPFIKSTDKLLHILYTTIDGGISDIYFDNGSKSWCYKDYSSDFPDAAAAVGEPDAIVEQWPNLPHMFSYRLYYRTTENQISVFSYDTLGRKNYRNLFDKIYHSPTPAVVKSSPVIVRFIFQGSIEHFIVYRDVNNHLSVIHSTVYYDLTTQKMENGLTPPATSSDPVPYIVGANGQTHILYRDINNNISDIFFPPSGERYYQNLTELAEGAPKALGTGKPSVYMAGSTPHVLYTNENFTVSDLYYENNKWQHQILNVAPFN